MHVNVGTVLLRLLVLVVTNVQIEYPTVSSPHLSNVLYSTYLLIPDTLLNKVFIIVATVITKVV
jgi:hypothetical protein